MTDQLPAHSPLGASSHYRWRACPGSVRLCKNVESVSSSYAEEGTLAHEWASKILLGEDVILSNGEMLDAVSVYTEYVRGLQHAHADAQTFVETKFNLSALYPGLYGTADCVIYCPTQKTLFVIDYKHGQGVPVEATNNTQLMYYGLGALHTHNYPVSTVVLVIVQPRCYHTEGPIRHWSLAPLDLLDFAADLIIDAKATEDPAAALLPGDHCRWCPAQPTCPAIHEKAMALARQAFAATHHYEAEKLADTLNFLPAMESWIKSVREFAYREAQAGRTPPGWKLVEKRARRKWKPGLGPLDFNRAFGVSPSCVADMKLKTPAQVEKILLKEEHKEKLQQFYVNESSGYTLVPETDNRQAVPDAIEAAFGEFE